MAPTWPSTPTPSTTGPRRPGRSTRPSCSALLSLRLGLEWGPERNGCRKVMGFSAAQLRAFSKRAVAIEAELERSGATYHSPTERMRALDAASLATRPAKDHSLTPNVLADRWEAEGRAVGLDDAVAVEAAVVGRRARAVELSPAEVVAGLLDPDTGLCADDARFSEAKVVERICAASAGRWTTEQILDLAVDFLASEHVVRLVPEIADARRRRPSGPRWSIGRWRTRCWTAWPASSTPRPRLCPPTWWRRPLPARAASAATRPRRCGPCAAVVPPCARSSPRPGSARPPPSMPPLPPAPPPAGPSWGWPPPTRRWPGCVRWAWRPMTIARLRIELDKRCLDPGTVVCSTRCPRWPPKTRRRSWRQWSPPPGPSCGAWAIPASPRPSLPGVWPPR